jgi:cation diffusion facilitator CzcD-associated flavoprotein CzcO
LADIVQEAELVPKRWRREVPPKIVSFLRCKNLYEIPSDSVIVDHPEEERRLFYENPKAYLKYRKRQEEYTNAVQQFFIKDSPALAMFTQMIDANMKETLKSRPDIYEKIKPDYPPGCRRLIMGQAWLESLIKDNADLINTELKRFTKKGIETVDGVEREYDAIICATGFDPYVSFSLLSLAYDY